MHNCSTTPKIFTSLLPSIRQHEHKLALFMLRAWMYEAVPFIHSAYFRHFPWSKWCSKCPFSEAQSLVGKKENESKDKLCNLWAAILKFKNPPETANYVWEVTAKLVRQENLPYVVRVPSLYLPHLLSWQVSLRTCVSGFSGPVPTPPGIKDKLCITFLESADPGCKTYPTSRFRIKGCGRVSQCSRNLTGGVADAGVSFLLWPFPEKMTFKS